MINRTKTKAIARMFWYDTAFLFKEVWFSMKMDKTGHFEEKMLRTEMVAVYLSRAVD